MSRFDPWWAHHLCGGPAGPIMFFSPVGEFACADVQPLVTRAGLNRRPIGGGVTSEATFGEKRGFFGENMRRHPNRGRGGNVKSVSGQSAGGIVPSRITTTTTIQISGGSYPAPPKIENEIAPVIDSAPAIVTPQRVAPRLIEGLEFHPYRERVALSHYSNI